MNRLYAWFIQAVAALLALAVLFGLVVVTLQARYSTNVTLVPFIVFACPQPADVFMHQDPPELMVCGGVPAVDECEPVPCEPVGDGARIESIGDQIENYAERTIDRLTSIDRRLRRLEKECK